MADWSYGFVYLEIFIIFSIVISISYLHMPLFLSSYFYVAIRVSDTYTS